MTDHLFRSAFSVLAGVIDHYIDFYNSLTVNKVVLFKVCHVLYSYCALLFSSFRTDPNSPSPWATYNTLTQSILMWWSGEMCSTWSSWSFPLTPLRGNGSQFSWVQKNDCGLDLQMDNMKSSWDWDQSITSGLWGCGYKKKKKRTKTQPLYIFLNLV